MTPQTLEGTWEEILARASELTGKRVRLTILEEESRDRPPTQSLAQLLQGRVGRVSFQPPNLSERTSETFTDLLVEKYEDR
ncbi:MAG: hypothetical protein AB4290_18925 [Spirulina sp.]